MTEETKKPWQSRTVVAGLFLFIVGILEVFGVDLPVWLTEILTGEEIVEKVNNATTVRGVLNSLLGIAIIYFRQQAQRAISGGIETVADPFVNLWNIITGLFKKK